MNGGLKLFTVKNRKLIVVRREGKDIIISCTDELQAMEIYRAISNALYIQQQKEDQFKGILKKPRRPFRI